MTIRTRRSHARRQSRAEGTNWLSFSDLMSSLLLIFVLIMFYIMYQYFDMYETKSQELAQKQFLLDQATEELDAKSSKLNENETLMATQKLQLDQKQEELDTAQDKLDTAESALAAQQAKLDQKQAELDTAQAQLTEKETEIARQQSALDVLSQQLTDKETQITAQQAALDEKETQITAQQSTLDEKELQIATQQASLNTLSRQLDEKEAQIGTQQQMLEDQQRQIEQLVGLKTRIITALSAAMKGANISATVDPTNGSIALESNVLFEVNKSDLSDRGRAFIDRFLPVYLNVLFSEDYRPYVAEIIVEGHTDSQGDYITNLKLSQQRALAVAAYVLSDDYRGVSTEHKRLLRQLVTANGRSWSDLVRDQNGNEDMDASRRVVFKFRLTDEQMIQQLKDILEAGE